MILVHRPRLGLAFLLMMTFSAATPGCRDRSQSTSPEPPPEIIAGFSYQRGLDVCDSTAYATSGMPGEVRIVGFKENRCPYSLWMTAWSVDGDSVRVEITHDGSPHFCEDPPCRGARYTVQLENVPAGVYGIIVRFRYVMSGSGYPPLIRTVFLSSIEVL